MTHDLVKDTGCDLSVQVVCHGPLGMVCGALQESELRWSKVDKKSFKVW